MVNYRRDYTPGGTYFFTITLRNRNADLLTRHIEPLRQAVRHVKQRYPFTLDAIVVLPNHLHALLTLPEDDCNYSIRWHQIKSQFTKNLLKRSLNLKPDARGEYHLWQRRFWEHRIKDDADFESHVDYIHFNPVKHGYVSAARDWPYSSFHRYVKDGVIRNCWGSEETNLISGDVYDI